METFTKFLYDFLGQFLAVFILMIQGFFKGIKQTFNIPQYVELFSKYKTSLNKPEWVLVTIALFIVAIVIFLIVAVAILFARRKIKFNKRGLNQDALLDEVATLNNKVVDLMKEKDELMAMKVSQLGLAPGESSTIDTATGESKDENGEKVDGAGLRFPKLISIDEKSFVELKPICDKIFKQHIQTFIWKCRSAANDHKNNVSFNFNLMPTLPCLSYMT